MGSDYDKSFRNLDNVITFNKTMFTLLKYHNKIYFFSAVFLIYLLLAVVFTFPLIANIKNSLIGLWAGDGLTYIWNVFIFWSEISKNHNPFFTNQIFYPIGTNLLFHAYAPLISLPGFLFLKNLIFYLNILILFALSLAAFCLFLLSYYLTKSKIAAFFSGLIYGFSPIMFAYLIAQHYHFVYAAFIPPLGLLFLFKFFEKFKIKYFALIIFCFWMSFFIEYYSTILFVFIIGFATLFLLIRSKNTVKDLLSKKKILKIILCSLSFFIVPLIAFLFLTHTLDFKDKVLSKSYYPVTCSTNLASFIIPSEYNLTFANFSNYLYLKLGVERSFDTPSYFLGFVITLITIFILIKLRKNSLTLIFGLGAAIFLLLSLGPNIRFARFELLNGNLTPFYWFSKVPSLGLIDCPIRFPIVVELFVSLIVGLGLAGLVKNKKIIYPLMFLIFLVEYGLNYIPIYSISTPLVYQKLALEKDTKSVLELPSGIAESKGAFGYDWSEQGLLNKQDYWQIIYQKPRFGGYVSRVTSNIYNFYKTEPIISDIFSMTSLNGKWSGKFYSKDQVKDFLEKFNLGYIILSPNPRQQQFLLVIDDLLKDYPYQKYTYEGFILYKLN